MTEHFTDGDFVRAVGDGPATPQESYFWDGERWRPDLDPEEDES